MGYKDSMNLYQAFGMNPANFFDPLGLEVKNIKLITEGPNELSKKISPELGKIPVLGPKKHGGNYGYAINIIVTFTKDDSGENYDPVQTAFRVYPNFDNKDPHRPGKSRIEMPDNPDDRFVDRSKKRLIWGDNPGIETRGIIPAKINIPFVCFFKSTVKPKKGCKGKVTNKVLYWGVKLIIKKGKIVESKAIPISKELYEKMLQQYKKM
jgi:hypothetical protein